MVRGFAPSSLRQLSAHRVPRSETDCFTDHGPLDGASSQTGNEAVQGVEYIRPPNIFFAPVPPLFIEETSQPSRPAPLPLRAPAGPAPTMIAVISRRMRAHQALYVHPSALTPASWGGHCQLVR